MKIRVQPHPDKKNLTRVVIDDTFILWFSYETCIAFESPTERVMTNAFFSRMTAGHKKVIDAPLVSDEEFQQTLRAYGFK